jgi:hypothetical protein
MVSPTRSPAARTSPSYLAFRLASRRVVTGRAVNVGIDGGAGGRLRPLPQGVDTAARAGHHQRLHGAEVQRHRHNRRDSRITGAHRRLECGHAHHPSSDPRTATEIRA